MLLLMGKVKAFNAQFRMGKKKKLVANFSDGGTIIVSKYTVWKDGKSIKCSIHPIF